jgi:hypothetical protein
MGEGMTAMSEHKKLAIQALHNMRGDDLYRARAAFQNCTPEQMHGQWGMSGKTRAEILAEYETYDAKVTAAIAWIESIQEPA